MEINNYLTPVSEDLFLEVSDLNNNQIGKRIEIFHDANRFPELGDFQLALVGVCDDRQAVGNSGCAEAPDKVRRAFYQLFCHWNQMKLVDLGNIQAGFSVNDTYFALNQVFTCLMMNHIVPIIIGGGQDITYAMYQVYQNSGSLVNIATIDSRFDLNEDDVVNSNSYLSHIVMHKPNFLFNYTNIGYQSYYESQDNITLMKDLLFDACRLGIAKADMGETEPLLRNADFVSFDMNAVRAADAPGNAKASPNGFNGEEICKLTRYAGLSSKLSALGIFEYNPRYDRCELTANLIAEMIWYFIEGFMDRCDDIPSPDHHDFRRYIVHADACDEDIVFLVHKYTGAWWIDLITKGDDGQQHYYVPCSRQDYEVAMQNDIPDRWWQYYQKLM